MTPQSSGSGGEEEKGLFTKCTPYQPLTGGLFLSSWEVVASTQHREPQGRGEEGTLCHRGSPKASGEADSSLITSVQPFLLRASLPLTLAAGLEFCLLPRLCLPHPLRTDSWDSMLLPEGKHWPRASIEFLFGHLALFFLGASPFPRQFCTLPPNLSMVNRALTNKPS